MSNIFFDLDGTLINSQHRLYNLFLELCPECKMSYEKYWQIKRKRITQKEFLKKYFNYSDEQYSIFHKNWLDKVEEPERFKQDFLVDGIEETLEALSKNHSLYIVTNRQSKNCTINELNEMNIKGFFCDIMVTEQKNTKAELIKESVSYSKNDFFIGDTGEDIKTAKELGIKSIGVTWGILAENVLAEYKPDKIIREVEEIGSCII